MTCSFEPCCEGVLSVEQLWLTFKCTCQATCLKLLQITCILRTKGEGLDETVRMRRLAWAFIVREYGSTLSHRPAHHSLVSDDDDSVSSFLLQPQDFCNESLVLESKKKCLKHSASYITNCCQDRHHNIVIVIPI